MLNFLKEYDKNVQLKFDLNYSTKKKKKDSSDTIGPFREAGLHERMPFVIFCARSCERLQCHFRADF